MAGHRNTPGGSIHSRVCRSNHDGSGLFFHKLREPVQQASELIWRHPARVELAQQRNELRDLHERNATLQAEVDDLRQGLQAIEERARSELGMVKEDEEFYQVIPGRPNGPDQPD